MIALTIKVEFSGENEIRTTEDTFNLSRVSPDEIDSAFLDEFVECAIGEGTACVYLDNVVVNNALCINEFKTLGRNGYQNLLMATHDMLTGSVYDWKILAHSIVEAL